MSGETLNYFAFGSNMYPNRLGQRIGSFKTLGVARLDSHRLVFHKRGGDNSGKCTVEKSTGDRVWGVLVEIGPEQKKTLDYYEGIGHGYDAVSKQVRLETRTIDALLYQAQLTAMDDGLVPFDWYKAFVLSGALHHALPQEYIRMIEEIRSVPDPDESRSSLNRKILEEGVDGAGWTG